MAARMPLRVRATPFRCVHSALGVPYRSHRAYELEIVGHGNTMAPRKGKVREWALDYMACKYDKEVSDYNDYPVEIEWL